MARRLVGTMALLAVLAAAGPTTVMAATPPPPGANDFGCKPTAAKPYPVVLVHGTFGNMFDSFQRISPGLKAQGYCVFALNYGGQQPAAAVGIFGTAEISGSARQLDAFVARVRSATGAAKVSLVGHSQGGMMPRYYLKFLGGTSEVDDLVGLAPSNHGTTNPFAGPAGVVCRACTQQIAGSPFLRNLNAGDETPGAVSYTQLVTRYDEVVIPHTSGFLAGGANTTNVRLQDRCPADFTEHLGIIYDPVAFQWVSNALARRGPANPVFRPVC